MLAVLPASPRLFHYSGVIHVHTRFSDGGGTLPEVGRVAHRLGLSFLIHTDHDTLAGHAADQPRRIGDTLLIPGVEISTERRRGHFLVFGETTPLTRAPQVSSEQVLADAEQRGLLTFLAHVLHPTEKLAWSDWDLGPYTGFELFNLDVSWRRYWEARELRPLISAILRYPFSEAGLLPVIAYPAPELAKFDELTAARRLVGIGSVDAHGLVRLTRRWKVRLPGYRQMFRLVQTICVSPRPFTGEDRHDQALVCEALRRGHAYIGFAGLGDPRGFVFAAEGPESTAVMGDPFALEPGATFVLRIPRARGTVVHLIHNGARIGTWTDTAHIAHPIGAPGTYRVEVFRRGRALPGLRTAPRPWILSNPIYVQAPAG